MADITIEAALKKELQQFATKLQNDVEFKKKANEAFAETYDPYVPYITGRLANRKTITEDGITYTQDYADEVYVSTHPHNLEYHPLASSRWDEVAMQNHRDEVEKKVADLANKRAKELLRNG